MELNLNSSNLGDFNKLSMDSINHIFTFLDHADIKRMNQINLNFHTIIATTFVCRKFLDQHCDTLISQIAVILPHISASEPETLDTIYQVIMKKPMLKIEKLDQVIVKCELFQHQMFLKILNQIEIFASHYKDKKELNDILLKKFIKECVCRLTIIDATFNCINSLLDGTNKTCHKMIKHMISARNEVEQQRPDQQSILLRIATNVSANWNLFDSSQEILEKHLELTKRLSITHQTVIKLYKIFVEARIQTVINTEKFVLKNFTNDITNILSFD